MAAICSSEQILCMPCVPAVPNGSSLDVVGELTESGEGHAHSQHEVFVVSNYSLANNQTHMLCTTETSCWCTNQCAYFQFARTVTMVQRYIHNGTEIGMVSVTANVGVEKHHAI